MTDEETRKRRAEENRLYRARLTPERRAANRAKQKAWEQRPEQLEKHKRDQQARNDAALTPEQLARRLSYREARRQAAEEAT